MANALAPRPTSYVATVVAIATEPLVDDTSATLRTLGTASAVRTILITLGDRAEPPIDRDATGQATTLHGLVPRFVNNAMAALRLSSLPSLVWWRSPEAELLPDIAHLVDRIVLDAPDAGPSWAQARQLRGVCSFSDLRWTRLTRWRSLMAQFFDLPDVRARADAYRQLRISAADADAARLFGAWMRSRLPNGKSLAVSVTASDAHLGPVSAVTLEGDGQELGLRLQPNRTCVEATLRRDRQPEAVRVVPIGSMSHVSLLCEEMRVRSRDVAFEEALEGVDQV